MENQKIIRLIELYRNHVSLALEILKETTNESNLLEAWRKGDIPSEGSHPPLMKYKFHGKGCFFKFDQFELEFDFCLENLECIGFDPWRLTLFAESLEGKDLDSNSLEEYFKFAVDNGYISKRGSLYFLSEGCLEIKNNKME